MRKKKPDIYENMKMRYWEGHAKASAIIDIFPNISKIEIDLKFKNPDWGGDPSPKNIIYGPNSKAYFKIQCPHWECVNGGYDLGSEIRSLWKEKGISKIGTLTCQGWQDKERINKHHCFLVMEYSITISYTDNKNI